MVVSLSSGRSSTWSDPAPSSESDKSPDSRVGASHQASETVVPTLGNVGTSRESGHDSIMKSNKWNRDMFRFLLYFIPDVLDFPSG